MATLFSALYALTYSSASTPPAPCRDRFLEPFSSDSIWNVAIGSKAVFAPANLYSTPDLYPSSFHNDQDFLVRLSPGGNIIGTIVYATAVQSHLTIVATIICHGITSNRVGTGNDTVELKWINQGDWGADDHCAVQNHRHSGLACSDASTALDGCTAPILLPRGWTSASDCDSDSRNCLSRLVSVAFSDILAFRRAFLSHLCFNAVMSILSFF